MATSSYFGRNSFVGAAVETTYGTPVTTPTVTRPIISCSLLRQVEKVERPNLRVSGVSGLRKSHYLVSDRVTGSLELECTYDNAGYWLHHCFGASAESGSSPNYIHTYNLGEVPAAGTTLRLQRGTSDYSETFEGVVFNNLSMSVASGEIMQMSLEMIGETSYDAEGPRGDTTLTFAEPTHDTPVLHHHAGTLQWNSQNFTLIDFEFSLQNGIAERMRLGSLTTKQPVQSDFRSVTMSVTIETDDVQGYKQFIDDTSGDAVVTFTGTDSRYMEFRLNNAFIESYEDSISEVGMVTASLVLKAQGGGTSGLDLGAQIQVRNKAATAVHGG